VKFGTKNIVIRDSLMSNSIKMMDIILIRRELIEIALFCK